MLILGKKNEEEKQDSKKSTSMGKGDFTLEMAEKDGKKGYICVFRNMIGKTLYQGTVSANKS